MGREMLKQGSQEAAMQEHFHPPTPITASQAQAMVITIALVPKLHPLLPRHFTHGTALPALLGQGSSEGLNVPHFTVCLVLLQAEMIWKLLCGSLLLTSAPTWQEKQSIQPNSSPSFPAPRVPY